MGGDCAEHTSFYLPSENAEASTSGLQFLLPAFPCGGPSAKYIQRTVDKLSIKP
jgi:hypothetical protein